MGEGHLKHLGRPVLLLLDWFHFQPIAKNTGLLVRETDLDIMVRCHQSRLPGYLPDMFGGWSWVYLPQGGDTAGLVSAGSLQRIDRKIHGTVDSCRLHAGRLRWAENEAGIGAEIVNQRVLPNSRPAFAIVKATKW